MWLAEHIPLWSNQNKMVRRIANGKAINISPTLKSQNRTAQLLAAVGMKATLVGSTSMSTLRMRPMYTNPVKKMSVSGVP